MQLIETPMQKIDDNLYLKREDLQIFGNIKSRAALQMLRDAEKSGVLDPLEPDRLTLVEGSSGNTAAALSHLATSRGYKIKIIMSEGVPETKKRKVLAAGASLSFSGSCIEDAEELGLREGYLNLNQYANESNVKAHIIGTGPEIIDQLRHTTPHKLLDARDVHVFSTIGTGGTVKGLHTCGFTVHGVEPEGSIFSHHADDSINFVTPTYKPWGGGQPVWRDGILGRKDIADLSSINVVKDSDVVLEAFNPYGIGPTSVAALIAARRFIAKQDDLRKPVVVICPDSLRNYKPEDIRGK